MTIPLTVLTHSSETAFKTCPRKFQLRYRRGLVPNHDSNALRLGTVYHAGLEVLKNLGTVDDAVSLVRDSYGAAECPPWFTTEQFEVECETAVALVRGYAARYGNDHIVDYLAVELKFDLPIVHPQTGREHGTYRNQGKIDGIARLPDGRIAIVEHKTSGEDIEPGADYWRRLSMDAQISRYFLAARAMGYDVSTVVYDVVRKPQIKPKNVSKADQAIATSHGHYYGYELVIRCPEHETPAMYGARLYDDVTTRADRYYARMEIPRLERDLDEFVAEQWQIAQQIASSERYGRYYRNTSACTSPYRCTYFDVCSTAHDPNETPAGFKVAEVLHPELANPVTEMA